LIFPKTHYIFYKLYTFYQTLEQHNLHELPVGISVTLRGDKMYEFLYRLINVVFPRVRDFRGLNPKSFDGRGNYSMGVKEQIINFYFHNLVVL